MAPDNSELAENVFEGLLIIRALSFVVHATNDGRLDVSFIPKDKEVDLEFIEDDTTGRIAAGAKLGLAILTVEGTCDKFLSEGRHRMEGEVRWDIRGLVLQQDEGIDFYRRVWILKARSKPSDDYAETLLFLKLFGLIKQ
jgi:hypothetical protein